MGPIMEQVSNYPFPDKKTSIEELYRDIVFDRIPSEEIREISDLAWNKGSEAAEKIIEMYPDLSIFELVEKEGLSIERIDKDNISGNLRFFSEYYSARKKIFLYTKAIKQWAAVNGMTSEEAEKLILAHEFYHHLECTKLGLTSKLYTVPWLQVGKLTFGRVSVRALSEIGAHGFSLKFYEKIKNSGRTGKSEKKAVLQNAAVNEFLGRTRSKSRDYFENNKILKILSGKWS